MKFLLFLTLPLYVLDQVTKYFVLKYVDPDEPRIIVSGFFALVHVTNTGAAFGSLKGYNLFFVILSFGALIFIGSLIVRARTPDIWRDVAIALLLAGVLGNLTDRLLHGHVIDFLLLDLQVWPAHPWPAFNVADSCICIAVVCFVIHSFRQNKEAAAA